MKSLLIIAVIASLISLLALSGCITTRDFRGLSFIENSQAKDVSIAEVQKFLQSDNTKYHPIIPYNENCSSPHDYVTSGYMCMNFGVDLHNNAEKAEIRCAVIIVKSYSEVTGNWTAHCFNGFNTTDKGMIYVDAGWGGDTLAYTDADGNVIIDCPPQGVESSCTEILGNPDNFKICQ
jgi:hypothetical protein